MTGQIKSLNPFGYGFIRAVGLQYFFHRSGVIGVRFEDLRPGQLVAFDVAPSERGPRADGVRPVEA